MSDKSQKLRIAVIGSGVAGLSAAYLLSEHGGHHVTIFEKAPALGFDQHGCELTVGKAGTARVDVPLRVFTGKPSSQSCVLVLLFHHGLAEAYYPNLTSL